MIKKDIVIDGMDIAFRASATVPRLYRAKFHRDIFRDLIILEKAVKDDGTERSDLPMEVLEMFENAAYIMAKHADPTQPETPDEWLEQFNVLSIYEVLPQILDLWHLNLKTDVEGKKNFDKIAGK